MFATDSPFGQFFDKDGKPLTGGYLYYGEANLNPVTNPKQVFWDSAGTLPAPSKIGTLNGYAVRLGSPALVYVDSAYSLLVVDKFGQQVFYLEDSSSLPSGLSVALGSKTDAAKGAGMAGLNRTLTYARGSVGYSINNDMVSVLDHPFNAVADGVTDCRQAIIDLLDHCNANSKIPFLPPGTYYLSDSIKPTNGTKLILRGAHRDLVTIKCAAGKIPFYCDQTIGVDNRITGADIEGITFDGGHVRDAAFYPYGSDPGSSIIQALNLRAAKGAGDKVNIRIANCRFKDINGLPFWIADADGSVDVLYNEFTRTKDLGILYCNNVTVVGNVVRFSADNGMSISRSNQNIYIAYNHITDCANSGIFVGGINSTGSGASLTLTGASYAVGATLTMAASAAKFGTEDQGIDFTLRSGTDRAIVRVVSVESSTSATVVAKLAVPATLQAISTADWARGPVSGAQAGGVYGNVIEGASQYGIYLSSGCKDLTISGNTIRRTGITADSETYTGCTMLAGSTTLALDSAILANNDWFVVIPDYTSEDYFISKANSGGTTTTIVANVAPPQSLIKERVYRAYRRTAAYGILAVGRYESATILEFAENLEIFGNTIVDSVTGGIRIGSDSGAVRKSSVFKNKITLRQTDHIEAAVYGILSSDVGNTSMRTVLLNFRDNEIRLNSAAGSRGISYKPIDSNAASYISIGPNTIQECVTEVEVIEQTGATNITRDYKPITQASSLPIASQTVTKLIGLEETPPTFNAGILTVSQSYGTPDISAGSIVVTDIALASTVLHDRPLIIVRNSHTVNTITFNHATAKIRTTTGANFVLNPYRAAGFVAVTASIWQQIF